MKYLALTFFVFCIFYSYAFSFEKIEYEEAKSIFDNSKFRISGEPWREFDLVNCPGFLRKGIYKEVGENHPELQQLVNPVEFWGTVSYYSTFIATGGAIINISMGEKVDWKLLGSLFLFSILTTEFSKNSFKSCIEQYNNWVDQNPEKIKNVQPNDSTLKVTYLYRF